MSNNTLFDEILLYNKYSNSKYLEDFYYIENKKLCEWLNENYTFCCDDFQQVNINSDFNTKNNCSYYKILLKNLDPNVKIKYISFVLLEDCKGPKFNIQYQDDNFLTYANIIKIFEFFTKKSLNIIYNDKSIFEKHDFDLLIETGYYYVCSYDKWYHIGISLNFHIFEFDIDNNYIADIQWTSDNRVGKVSKNLSKDYDTFSCYN
jgi:hypothetical protein